MTVAVVTDSAAALPPDVAADHRVTVVPLQLTVGGTAHRDGELGLEHVLERLDEGVSTSGPPPADFARAIEERLSGGAGSVLVLTIAASMSSTHGAARLACEQVDEGGGVVRVLDTATASGAQALVVLAAARRAREGASLDEVEDAARRVAGRVRLIATVPNLDRLVRSGRVPAIAGWAGRSLGVQPLFEFRRGKVKRLRPAFSRDAALDRIVTACRGSRRDGRSLHAVALHAQDPESAERLLAEATAGEPGVAMSLVTSFSPVMIVHTGPGLAGLAWYRE